MPKADEVMTETVTRLVEMIEAGAGKWEMPWREVAISGMPRNALTGKDYRGGNIVAFMLKAMDKGYASNDWATFKQWQEIGGYEDIVNDKGETVRKFRANVRKGERGTYGLIYKPIPAKVIGTDDDGNDVLGKSGAYCSTFVVFNREQVDGLPAVAPKVPVSPLERLQHCEAWLATIPADIRYGGNRAYYTPGLDYVQIPDWDAFKSPLHGYATLTHELAHWTGNSLRCNRVFGKRFGDDAYAAEELVAELSSAFTCATLGIDTVARADHAAYLASWIRVLKADPGILWSIAGKASAATDYLHSFSADITADIDQAA